MFEVTGEANLSGLARRLPSGDPDAWEKLYVLAYPRLLAYAWRKLGSRHAADEAVSETMTRAIAGIHRYRPLGPGPVAWLFGILRNVTLELGRKLGPAGEPGDVAGGDDPAEVVMDAEESVLLRQAFLSLGPEDREILELRVAGRLSAADVGKLIGKRPGAVRMAQSRAVARLREAAIEVGLDG